MKPHLAFFLPPVLCLLLLLPVALSRSKLPSTISEPGTCQDVATMDVSTASEVLQLTRRLVADQFFAIFHVSVDRPCPFWDDDGGKCAMRECSVCDCPADEVPAIWRSADAADSSGAAAQLSSAPVSSAAGAGGSGVSPAVASGAIPFSCESTHGDGDALNDIDRSLSGGVRAGEEMRNWAAPPAMDDWTVQEAGSGGELLYVDLRKNPERYTGFTGRETHRLWSAIYDENCIAARDKCKDGVCAPDTCKEERVFHKLISGIHTSITMHIAAGYLLGTKWGRNVGIFENRVRKFPERGENLKMTLGLLLRAVAKVAPSLDPSVFAYATGNPAQDKETALRVRALLAHPVLARGCEELVFDEKDMFVAQSRDRLPEFCGAFRNISMIMDCVGCEKCRLWGKLQFLGLGTALRILFTENDERRLKRNEVIALINLLHKLLSSIVWADEFEKQLAVRAVQYALLGKFVGALAVCLVSLAVFKKQERDEELQVKGGAASDTGTLKDLRTLAGKDKQPTGAEQLPRRRRQASAD